MSPMLMDGATQIERRRPGVCRDRERLDSGCDELAAHFRERLTNIDGAESDEHAAAAISVTAASGVSSS
jgi:hypothetical protein